MAPVGNSRLEVDEGDIQKGLAHIQAKLRQRLQKKGYGQYISRHEIYGILAEEMDEVLDELRINSPEGYENFSKELLDVAVGALFGYICCEFGYIKPKVINGKGRQ